MHLASLLLEAGHRDEAVAHLGAVLQADPGNAQALSLLVSVQQPLGRPVPSATASPVRAPPERQARSDATPDRPERPASQQSTRLTQPTAGDPPPPHHPRTGAEFNWAEAEAELRDVLPPMFVTPDGAAEPGAAAPARWTRPRRRRLTTPSGPAFGSLTWPGWPRSRRAWRRRSWPRCGTRSCASCTARACAAASCSTGRRAAARRSSPGPSPGNSAPGSWPSPSPTWSTCTSAPASATSGRSSPPPVRMRPASVPGRGGRLGQKRSQLRSTPMRSTVNQLLLELDDVTGANEGVFVLAATNHPWDVDSALRRPGRLDRTLLVLPPDEQAREAVFRYPPARPACSWHRAGEPGGPDRRLLRRRHRTYLRERRRAGAARLGPDRPGPHDRPGRPRSPRPARSGRRWARGSTRRATSRCSPTRAAAMTTSPPT